MKKSIMASVIKTETGGEDTTDMLFLLSTEEVTAYFFSETDRQCVPTRYAEVRGINRYKGNDARDGFCRWWLRSPAFPEIPDRTRFASDISMNGGLGCSWVTLDTTAVRPALWLNLSSVSD